MRDSVRSWAGRSVGAAVLVGLLAGCGGGQPAPSSSSADEPTPTSSSTSAAPETSAAAPSETPSGSSPVVGPTIGTDTLAAFQLCGTALGLAAGFIGQVAPDQLDEGEAAVAAAKQAYVDDGSGLLAAVDAVLTAVERADQAAVVSSSKALADVCKSFDPGT